jgi:peptidoglycan/LPS O-acetylase OafA/YrhL
LWIGVDVFFVLSGFLIGRILLRQVRNGRVDYRGFYVRRVARIVPAYYLVLTVAAIVLSRLPTFAPLYATLSSRDLVAGGLKDALFLNNYLRSGPDVMGWAWSLCVEEHFYLVLPVFLSMLFRISPRSRLAVVALLPLLLCSAAPYREPRSCYGTTSAFNRTHSDGLLSA